MKVLFVCLGNICRSPTAEAVFRKKVLDAGLTERIHIDSAGTAGYHTGSPPDKRSLEAGEARGYDFEGISCRRVQDSDFQVFDYIIPMDRANYDSLIERSPEEFHSKIRLMMSFSDIKHIDEVPDPYYGGRKGFEMVIELIERACDGLLTEVRAN